jgi:hypothetical protein
VKGLGNSTRSLFIFLACAAIGVSLYVGVAAVSGHSGFPLDDAWIHQTYARNWAETGQLAYVVGQPSAGSTAPLWTLFIALGYRLRFDPIVWTRILGTLCLGVSAWLVSRLARRLRPDLSSIGWLAGLATVFEWHLIWAAASGMETALFIALSLAVLDRALAHARGWIIGLLGGALILTRPEGLVLMGLVLVVTVARPTGSRVRSAAALLIGLILAVTPGLWFNLQAGGTVFPNTFYAKQSEYASLTSSPTIWLQSFAEMIVAPLAGVLLLLLPGLVAWGLIHLNRLRDRARWHIYLPLAWAVAHVAVYGLKLPVHYQHGRYLIPIVPVVLLYGVVGTADLFVPHSGRAIKPLKRNLGMALSLSTAALLGVFFVLGARAYAVDVAVIDDEMVVAARWLDRNTPLDAVIAAHDIGAIGYFARRPLLDLAGLISPEVVPFIRDEGQLWTWLQSHGARYLVTFPSWYPMLVREPQLTSVFAGDSPVSDDHMTVYRLTSIH